MDYRQMHRLQNVAADPAVTILVPTHRLAPGNEDDPVVVARAVDAAERKLNRAGHGLVAAVLCGKVREVLADFDWSSTLDGLVIFAGMTGSPWPLVVAVKVPYRVKSRTYIGDRFNFDDIALARHDITPHIVVHLTYESARVYRGEFDALTECGETPASSRAGLADLLNEVDGPIVVLSETGRLDRWVDHIPTGRIVGSAQVGDVARTPAAVKYLGSQAWSVVDDAIRARRYRLLDALGQAHDTGHTIRGLSSVRAALAKRKLRALYVEETFHSVVGGDDEVDTLIGAARAAKVPVHLFEHGTLSGWGHIVGIAR